MSEPRSLPCDHWPSFKKKGCTVCKGTGFTTFDLAEIRERVRWAHGDGLQAHIDRGRLMRLVDMVKA